MENEIIEITVLTLNQAFIGFMLFVLIVIGIIALGDWMKSKKKQEY